jgi:putative FmdB family regulatory protein
VPIYEYQAADPDQSCPKCKEPFEILQNLRDEPLQVCPSCGSRVTRIISWCRAAIAEAAEEDIRVNRTVKDYESAGLWSHAAELADKHSEKTKDESLKNRALENYKKAGYNVDSLTK